MFGDLGYTRNDVLQTPFKGVSPTDAETRFNYLMARIRVPVEWAFGDVLRYFAFVDFKKNIKMGLQPCGKFFHVATFLRNCHVCFYGHETASYFGCPAPDLSDYLVSLSAI
ncbi:hypothetical protein CTAYLR_010236 [Chrysophaeum taylorii]|uniref:DDE Tnp4 domain-containing protein n=1 Tax=Chrysophaeum taylorii TaxID=2483200 RepID=A0AAD7UBM6_9STRA|nr:hypothetical protein CTAYLR_010236 [Chrysophaeum taylorii]